MINKIRINAFQIFQLLRYAGLLVVSIILPHKGFNSYEISQYESFLFFVGFSTFFWVGGIMNRYLKYDSEENLENYTNHFILLFLILTFLVSIVLLIVNSMIPIYGIFYIVCYLFVSTLLFIVEHYFILKKWDHGLWYYSLIALLIPGLSAILCNSINELILWLIFFTFIKFLGTFLYLKINFKFKFNFFKTIHFNNILPIVSQSSPFIIALLASGSSDYIDGFIVKNYFEYNQFSIFRYGARELPFVLILANTLSLTMIPVLKLELFDGLKVLKKNSRFLMHLSFPIAIFLMIFSKSLFIYFFTVQFQDAAIIFQTYLLLIIPRLIFPQTILQTIDTGRWILISAIIELVLNFTISIILLQYFGLSGIAFGTFIAFVADKFFLGFILFKKYKISPKSYISLNLWAGYSFLLLLTYILISLSKWRL